VWAGQKRLSQLAKWKTAEEVCFPAFLFYAGNGDLLHDTASVHSIRLPGMSYTPQTHPCTHT